MGQDKEYDKIILGIDPGTNIMGYGVIGIIRKEYEMLSMGIIDVKKESNHALKLQRIFERCSVLMEQYHPDEVALEAPFFGKNVQSMLKLGRAQGVAMAAALNRRIPIFEYAPKRIKQAVTGNGNASKEQVAAMLQTIFKYETQPKKLDATDALSVALCHHFMSTNKLGGGSKGGGWKSFISKNPDRVV